MDKRTKTIVVGVAAAGSSCVLAYYMYKQYQKENNPTTKEGETLIKVQVEQVHKAWLKEMGDKYTSGDTSKAVQLLIEHCILFSGDIKATETIFKKIRCNTCADGVDKIEIEPCVMSPHKAFLENAVSQFEIKGGIAKAVRIMCDYGMDDGVDTSTIFQG